MEKTKNNFPKINADVITKIIVIFVMGLCIVPLIVYGKNSFVAVLDYVDSIVGFTKMFRDKELFYQLNTPMPALQGISTTFYTFVNFGAYSFIMNYCGAYWGHVVNYTLSILLGYFSISILLRYFIKDREKWPLIRLVAVAYAILPVIPNVAYGYATLPFMIYCFFVLWKKEKFEKKCLLLIILPFFSSLYIASIFIFGFWALGIIIYTIYHKKINWNLVVGLLVMVISSVIIDMKLFYSAFFSGETLNRVIGVTNEAANIGEILATFKHFLIYGYPHVSTVQKYVIIPTCGLFFIYLCIKKWNTKLFWTAAGLSTAIVLFYGLATIHDIGLIKPFIEKICPFLNGFDWGRIHYLNRILWYVFFLLALLELLKYEKLKIVAYLLAVAQIVQIIVMPEVYNDILKNLRHESTLQKNEEVTFAEFYSEELFEQIKQDIDYQDEVVVALGYFPSVLMYNGFHCLDGYMSYYPLKNMVAFRKLLEPEFAVNKEAQEYFDSWGGRMYLYNADVTYNVCRKQSTVPVELHIDMDVYKGFQGKYIFSRVPVSNDKELQIELIKEYVNQYYYNMYVYQVVE